MSELEPHDRADPKKLRQLLGVPDRPRNLLPPGHGRRAHQLQRDLGFTLRLKSGPTSRILREAGFRMTPYDREGGVPYRAASA